MTQIVFDNITPVRSRRTDPQTSHDADEEWRPIPGFTRYSVSDQGRVRRDVTIYRSKPGLCSTNCGKDGYPKVALTSDDGKYKSICVHSLVMLAFVGPRPSGMHVCHNDGSRDNNRLKNLRYDTPKGNVHDAIRHGTQVYGESVTQHILTEQHVSEIVSMLDAGSTYIALAERFGVTKHCIFRIAAGKTWRHITGGKDRRNGYKFTYIGGLAAKQARQKKREGLIEPTGLIVGGYRCWRLM